MYISIMCVRKFFASYETGFCILKRNGCRVIAEKLFKINKNHWWEKYTFIYVLKNLYPNDHNFNAFIITSYFLLKFFKLNWFYENLIRKSFHNRITLNIYTGYYFKIIFMPNKFMCIYEA